MNVSYIFDKALRSLPAVALVLNTSVFAQSYTAFDIGTLGGTATYGAALNATGQVTGNSVIAPGGPYHAFITDANGKNIRDLGSFSGGNTSQGLGINASGQVVGEAEKGDGLVTTPHAFITGPNGNGMIDFTGRDYSRATGINDSGQVVGNANDPLSAGGEGVFVTGPNATGFNFIATGVGFASIGTDINASGQVVGQGNVASSLHGHAFITSPNHSFVSDLGSLTLYDTSYAAAVNDSGKVVGNSLVGLFNPSHAFITDINSDMTDLGTLGGQDSFAWDINSAGVVVGWSTAAHGSAHHAFITDAGGTGMTDLNSLVTLSNGTFLVEAKGINDRGQILANASDGHAYLLSPVPEPETYAMLLAGLSVMTCIVRRRKIYADLS
jgi:probable HAF family extracellular repeat protein